LRIKLRVHPVFNTLARAISSDIEIYRFDINEDWRSGVRVMRRMKVNSAEDISQTRESKL
jgi:hypothetical protein